MVPMPYIALGRLVNASSKLSHVRLIVPSQQGQLNASKAVYPCYYDLLSREVLIGGEERRSKRIEREKLITQENN